MASLKETKDRISSVKSTLKITSAMKLLAGAKLHKTQVTISALQSYKDELDYCLKQIGSGSVNISAAPNAKDRVCIVAFSSNSSLCGAFNASIIRKTAKVLSECNSKPVCYFFGKKVSEAMEKCGYKSELNLNNLIDHPDYTSSAQFVDKLLKDFENGEFKEVRLIFSHHISTSSSEVTCRVLLPSQFNYVADESNDMPEPDYILEPDAESIRRSLFQKLLHLDFHYTLLDSCLSEHSARTIAMQTATENGENMLSDLTLEYNKNRQAIITSEILELEGGSVQE